MFIKASVFAVLLFGFAVAGYSQSTRDVDAPKPPKPVYQSQKTEKGFLFFKKKNKISNVDEVKEFRKRMKKQAKKRAKNERIASKPQYSNPLYFGHKKPPKKRKNGKKKFCKECGLWH